MSCDAKEKKAAQAGTRSGAPGSANQSVGQACQALVCSDDKRPPVLKSVRVYRGGRAFKSFATAARAGCLTPSPNSPGARYDGGRYVEYQAVFDGGVFWATLCFYEDGSVELASARSHPGGIGLGRAALTDLHDQLLEAGYDAPMILSATDEAAGFWEKMAEERLVDY